MRFLPPQEEEAPMFRRALSRKALLGLGTLAVVALLSASHALADQCSLKDIKGVYVGTFTGFNIGGPFAGPFAAVSRIVCDGKGECAGSGTQSLNGIVLPLIDTGHDVVTVNPDCTGTITVNLPGPPFALHFNTIQTLDGKEAWSIQTDPGTVITGHIQLIKRATD
jgi:hypothetical protein